MLKKYRKPKVNITIGSPVPWYKKLINWSIIMNKINKNNTKPMVASGATGVRLQKWKCEACNTGGTIEYRDGDDVITVIKLIKKQHNECTNCKFDVNCVRILPT